MKTKAHKSGQSIALIFMSSCVTFVLGQVNSELDKPFVTKDGARYRDILTIASAKGVAQFAKSYQRTQRGAVSQIVPNSSPCTFKNYIIHIKTLTYLLCI